MGILKFLCKLVARGMCRNFRLRTFDKKPFCFGFKSRRKRRSKCLLPGWGIFTRDAKHLRSDQEICIPTARDALQPIYVTEITRNFPSEILMPFASARCEYGEINLLSSGNLDNSFISDSKVSVESEENAITEIFAWVYTMEITEENIPDGLPTSSGREN